MFLEVISQAAEGPALFKAEIPHLVISLFRRQTQEVDLIKCGDQGGAIPSDGAMKVDRPKALV